MRILAALIIIAGSSAPAVAEQNQRIGEDLVETANREFHKENFAGAHAALDQFEKVNGPTVDSLDLRGCIQMEQKNFEGAAKAFAEAHQLKPAIFAPRLHSADLLFRQKEYAKARSQYETLFRETNILLASERLRFAILMTYLGEHDETGARQALDRVTFPTQSPAYYYAQAAWSYAHDKPKDAQKWLKSAEKVYNTENTAWFARQLYEFGWLKDKPPLPPHNLARKTQPL